MHVSSDPDIDAMNATDWNEGYVQDRFGLPCRFCDCDLFALLAGATDGAGSTRMMCSGTCQPWAFRKDERLVGYVDISEYRETGIPWVISAEEAERRGYTPARPRQYRPPFASKELSEEEMERHRAEMAESRRRGFNWWELKRRREKEGLPKLDEAEFIRIWNGEE